MATTKADRTYTIWDMTVKEKLTTWQTLKINPVKWIVIHNTPTVTHSNSSMAAQYALAQYNHNLDVVCVHYYVDEKEIWHCLPDTIKGVHATDNKDKNGGNWCGIAIECIEDKTNAVAEDKTAKLAAYLLNQYGLTIDALKQHHDFYNKDCPLVIRPHWTEFKAKVSGYLAELQKPKETATQNSSTSGIIYTVQTGAFSSKQNAENFAKSLSAKGINCFVTIKGDVDGDGKITVADAQEILKKAVGK